MHKFLRMRDVIESTGLARSTIYKKIAEKTFPGQISLSTNAVGWLESDIKKWQDEMIMRSKN